MKMGNQRACVFVITRLVMRFPHFLFILLLSFTVTVGSSTQRLLKARPAGRL